MVITMLVAFTLIATSCKDKPAAPSATDPVSEKIVAAEGNKAAIQKQCGPQLNDVIQLSRDGKQARAWVLFQHLLYTDSKDTDTLAATAWFVANASRPVKNTARAVQWAKDAFTTNGNKSVKYGDALAEALFRDDQPAYALKILKRLMAIHKDDPVKMAYLKKRHDTLKFGKATDTPRPYPVYPFE